MNYPPLMDKQTYDGLVAKLVDCQPEDLVNIISRVLMDRADVEHITTEPVAGSTTTNLETGQFTVPGCPGGRDCPSSHDQGHIAVWDRQFTIAIRGTETWKTTQARPADADRVDAQVGYECSACRTVKPMGELRTIELDGVAGTNWICDACVMA